MVQEQLLGLELLLELQQIQLLVQLLLVLAMLQPQLLEQLEQGLKLPYSLKNC
jgi:hypothetical protein